MTGCLFGAKRLKRGGEEVLDVHLRPIWVGNCGKVCDVGKKYCPKHEIIEQAREAAKK